MDHGQFPIGTMTWGKLLGYDWWPGCVISHDEGGKGKKEEEEGGGSMEEEPSSGPQFWIKWFGDNQLSQVIKLSTCLQARCIWIWICIEDLLQLICFFPFEMIVYFRFLLKGWLGLRSSSPTSNPCT